MQFFLAACERMRKCLRDEIRGFFLYVVAKDGENGDVRIFFFPHTYFESVCVCLCNCLSGKEATRAGNIFPTFAQDKAVRRLSFKDGEPILTPLHRFA